MTILRSCCSQCGKGELEQRAEKTLGQLNLVFSCLQEDGKLPPPCPRAASANPVPQGSSISEQAECSAPLAPLKPITL